MDDLQEMLRATFLEEASELLVSAEQAFLQLESSPGDPSIIEKIFRIAHNLKGSAKAVGFEEIGEFTHELESLLLKIKNKEIGLSSKVLDLLLRCNDQLTLFTNELKQGQPNTPNPALQQEIREAIQGKYSDESAPAEATPAAEEPFVESAPTMPEAQDARFQEENSPPVESSSNDVREVNAEVNAEEKRPEPKIQVPVAAAPVKKVETQHANADESIRVSLVRLEKLVNNIGELVILQTVLTEQRQQIPSQFLQKTITQLSKITKDIQDISMGLRMVPLKQTFQKMQRIVRDTSKTLGKDVTLAVSGEETELDKTVVDQLGDPLVHLIRNAVDHGLESTEDRISAGKNPEGSISLAAMHKGGKIVIEVRDDGRGLDADKLRSKAVEKGLMQNASNLTDQEAYNLIFHPGFSTKAVVTDISGRGVGLDVVKNNIEKVLQGEVQLDTVLGKGTTFRILLPLTLAIIDGMVVRTSGECYVVPLTHVYECVKPRPADIHYVTGIGDVMTLRGENLPMHRLGHVLGRKTKGNEVAEETAIVVRTGHQPFSILVDEIMGRQQVVIKKLGDELGSQRGISGGAILGDGGAALILDLNELVNRTQNNMPAKRGVAS